MSTQTRQHDLVVIGGGPGGYVAALRAAQLGLNVACVEQESTLGGTCLRIGCIPSKALLESSELYHRTRVGLAEHGIRVQGVSMDLPAMHERKNKVVRELGQGIDALFKRGKIARYRGRGRLVAPGEISVKGQSAEESRVTATHIILATGSRPRSLPGLEFDGEFIGTSTEALAYSEPPRRLVVLGAGAIGLELGSVWQRLGSQVTVLEYLDRILPETDGEVAAEALKIFTRQGLQFQLGTRVTAARRDGAECRVERGEGEPIVCDRVLVAIGRVPNTSDLGLVEAGVRLDARGFVQVNERFETDAPGVFAIGDCIPGPMLAHKAEEEGVACVEQIATGYGHVNYQTIPSVVYTQPEIASVGWTEDRLKERSEPYRKGTFPFRANSRARVLGAAEGMVKVLAHAETDRILGVHILGPQAGELIAEAAVAMEFGASSEDLARCCHAHPTLAEAIKEAALAADGRALHR